MNKDLTVGNPEKVLWKFCLPLFASIIFQQIYNLADSWVAGKFISEEALAAVGNGYEITLIFIAFAFGCNIGCSVITSKLFGAKEYTQMKTAISTVMISSLVLCLLLMILGLSLCSEMLKWINTPDNIFKDSKLYLEIYIWGLPFVFFYNISSGIFSALGDSKTPFWFLAISSISNIFVDILFVKAFNMGVAGVAWATFFCQGVSCVLALVFVFLRLKKINLTEKAPLFSFNLFKKIAVIAIPSILQQSFISVGNIIIQSIINGYGSGVIAGYSAAIKLNNLVTTSFTTIGNGISNYTAQNLGAGKTKRVPKGFTAGWKMVWTLCIPLVAIYVCAGKYLVNFFIENPSEEAITTGRNMLWIISPFYFVLSVKLAIDGILRGSGKMGQFMIGTFLDLGLRVCLSFLFSYLFGSIGIWWSWPVGWVLGCVASLIFYIIDVKKNFGYPIEDDVSNLVTDSIE